MNELLKPKETTKDIRDLNPVIKISHFDDDKHVKTDIYPVSHFLDKSTREIKTVIYS